MDLFEAISRMVEDSLTRCIGSVLKETGGQSGMMVDNGRNGTIETRNVDKTSEVICQEIVVLVVVG